MDITQTTLENILTKITNSTSSNDIIWNNYLQTAQFTDGERVALFLEPYKITISYIDDNSKTNFIFDNGETMLMNSTWFTNKFTSLTSAISTQMSNLQQSKLTTFLNKMS